MSNAKELRKYLERGGDPNGVTKKDSYKGKQTLLHRAAIYRDEEIVTILLAAGANPNGGDSTSGWTPLMVVFTTRDEDTSRLGDIKCLLKVSDLTIKDESGMTAYDYAKKYGLVEESELVREALEARSKNGEENP